LVRLLMRMHIKATCPECESTYQVDPGLQGKRMRCPNPICRAIFEVQDTAAATLPAAPLPAPPPPAPSPPPLPRPQRLPSVGEVVTVRPAEPMEDRPLFDEFFAGASPESHTGPEVFQAADAVPGAWEGAPPVRQGLGDIASTAPTNGVGILSPSGFDLPAEVLPPRRGHWKLILLGAVTLAAIGSAIWLFTSTEPKDEAERFAKAENEYKDRNFAEAAALFRSLWQDFPQSEQRPTYKAYAELSNIRDAIHRTQTDADETVGHLDRLKQFLEIYQGDPLIDNHREDIANSLYRLVEELTGFASKEKKRSLLELAQRLNADTAKRFKPAPLQQNANIKSGFDDAEQQVLKAETRASVLAQLQKYIARPSLEAVEHAPRLVQEAGLASDPEVMAFAEGLAEKHRLSVKYSPDSSGGGNRSMVADSPPSVAVLNFHGQRAFANPSTATAPVFALVRGVLYAFDGAGTLSWVRRVGTDATVLPLRVPATVVSPPLVVVASAVEKDDLARSWDVQPSDELGSLPLEVGRLLAFHAGDGSLQWWQVLPEPCAGQPLLFGNRLLVCGRGGTVFEIDALSGRRLGSYRLGLDLSHGGVRQPGTSYVYFAADRGCVFVVDAAERQCVDILYTGHPSGSLHCAPVVLPLSRGEVIDPNKAGPPLGQLLLCQDDGHQGTEVLSYSLPISDPHALATRLGEKLPGRIWYPPLFNPEQFTLITDAGAFTAYGLRQRDNRDPDVFTLLRESLGTSLSASGDRPLPIHTDGRNFWVLAQGRLHHFQVSMSPQEGWKIVSRPLPLSSVGSALHAAQVQLDEQGRTSAYLVTESPDGRACWVSAVDLDQHAIRWQRQIGFVPQNMPAAIGGKVLAWDRSGALQVFDPEKAVKLPGTRWQRNGRPALLDQLGMNWLFPHEDGKRLLAFSVQNLQAKVWLYRDGMTTALGKPLALEAPLAGTPALMGETLVLPLANGRLARFGPGSVAGDYEWRSGLADKTALGHAVAIGSAKLACTNGSHGLTLWHAEGGSLVLDKKAEVKARIIAAPAVLAGIGQSQEWGLCVADVDRGVTLFQGDKLIKVREWAMSDAITAGPFARGGGIVLVLGGRRLVWLDTDSEKPRWALTVRADIVGEPLLIDGCLVVADESGQIQALDPATGRPVGLGYALHAAVAPTGSVLPYGTDRLFVPLTDGTVLLPSREWFRSSLLGIPLKR
jgi:outer membrane protein assembly factor BamB